MDIFLMFIFNIFTGAVIFLVLSLKIEKTSSTFQEKKLRREMGEIITEFNSTAERNISLLESRISVLKKLMNENGSLKGIDFTVLDDKLTDNKGSGKQEVHLAVNSKDRETVQKVIIKDSIGNRDTVHRKEKKLIDTFMDKIQSINRNDDTLNKILTEVKSVDEVKVNNTKKSGNHVIEKSVSDFPVRKSNSLDLVADEEIVLTYDREKDISISIEERFRNADDKYLLIARLFSEGHSIEELSKYSGIPSGEIKLVISLNS